MARFFKFLMKVFIVNSRLVLKIGIVFLSLTSLRLPCSSDRHSISTADITKNSGLFVPQSYFSVRWFVMFYCPFVAQKWHPRASGTTIFVCYMLRGRFIFSALQAAIVATKVPTSIWRKRVASCATRSVVTVTDAIRFSTGRGFQQNKVALWVFHSENKDI